MQFKKENLILICNKVMEFCIYGFVFFLPVSNALIEICVGWSIFALLIKKIVQKQFPKTPLNILIGVYFLSLLVSTSFSTHMVVSMRTVFAKILHYIAFYFVVADVVTDKRILKKVLFILSLSVMLICIDGVQQYFTHLDFIRQRYWPWGLYDGRITACFTTPNSLAAYLLAVIMIIISSFLYFKPIWKKNYYIILFLLALICLLFTLTWGAWIAFGLSLFFFMILNRDRKPTIPIALGCLLFIVAFYLLNRLSILKNLLGYRIINIFSIFHISDTERIGLWQMSWQMFRDSPIWGQGIGTFMHNFSRFSLFPPSQQVSYAHNSYLQLLAETGILGLGTFFSIIIAILYKAIKKYLEAKNNDWNIIQLGFISALIAFLIHAFFDNHFYSLTFSLLFWFLVGINVSFLKG